MKKFILLLICITLLFISCNKENKKQDTTIEEQTEKVVQLNKTMFVNASSGLRVRSTPSTDGEVLGRLENSTKVNITRENNNIEINGIQGKWVYINSPVEGWIFNGYLTEEIIDYIEQDLIDFLFISNLHNFTNIENDSNFHILDINEIDFLNYEGLYIVDSIISGDLYFGSSTINNQAEILIQILYNNDSKEINIIANFPVEYKSSRIKKQEFENFYTIMAATGGAAGGFLLNMYFTNKGIVLHYWCKKPDWENNILYEYKANILLRKKNDL